MTARWPVAPLLAYVESVKLAPSCRGMCEDELTGTDCAHRRQGKRERGGCVMNRDNQIMLDAWLTMFWWLFLLVGGAGGCFYIFERAFR